MMPPPNRTGVIIRRVEQLAERREVTMTEISLAWLLTKTASPVVGATKLQHIEEMVGAAELSLSEEEIAFLEEAYVPHKLVGSNGAEYDGGFCGPSCRVWSATRKYNGGTDAARRYYE